MFAVMFYVTLNKRKRLGDCVTFSYLSGYPGRAAHTVMFLNMRYMPAMHHAVKCQGAASYHAFSQRVHAGCQFSPTSSWCGLGSCGSHQLDRSRSPKMHCIHLLVIYKEPHFLSTMAGVHHIGVAKASQLPTYTDIPQRRTIFLELTPNQTAKSRARTMLAYIYTCAVYTAGLGIKWKFCARTY